MCGICGYRSPSGADLGAMLRAMAHRGPDGQGTYASGDVRLGHRRLAIIDLEGGVQPMLHKAPDVALVFNGEIYNFQELREDLKERGHRFTTRSDTEVLLHMYLEYGTAMLERLNGMFAFVLHDAGRDLLFGARDRLGIKPLYYAQTGKGFFFASEIKALTAAGCVSRKASPASLDLYFTYRYVPGERTSFADVKKLKPGHYFLQRGDDPLRIERYWDFPADRSPLDLDEAVDEYARLLDSAVSYRLISDVPLGVFLSGGVDSTAIASVMGELGHDPIKAFTVGFGTARDETEEARRTARHLGCIHGEVVVPEDGLELLPTLQRHMDDPFGDVILLPLYLLCAEAARSVKVVLSGDGADEAQLGYIHHENIAKGLRLGPILPAPLWALAGRASQCVPLALLDKLFHYPDSMGPQGRKRLGEFCASMRSPGRAYGVFTSLFTPEDRKRLFGPVLRRGQEQAEQEFHAPLRRRLDDSSRPLRSIYLHDLAHWLPDNILNKFDKMSMATSIEGRVPFLDHRIVELLARLPEDHLLHQGQGKRVLRTMFERRFAIPGRRTNRKQAFYFPLRDGFAAGFGRLVDTWLAPGAIDDRLLDRREVAAIVGRLSQGSLLDSKQAFALVAFQMWNRELQPEWY